MGINMVRRSTPGKNNKLSKPQLKPKEIPPKEENPISVIDDCFPLSKDSVYQSLSSAKRMFVYYQYLKPVTGWTNSRIYKQIRPNVTEDSAWILASKWMKDPDIMYCLNRLKVIYDERLGYTADRIMNELGALAFSDVANYFDETGKLRTNPLDLPPRARAAIASFELRYDQMGEEYWKITQWNKNDALKSLIKIQGMEAPQKHELSGPGGKAIEINTRTKVDLAFLTNAEVNLLCKIVKANQSEVGAEE